MPKTTLEQALFQGPPVRGCLGPQTLVNNDVCFKKCTPTVFEALWLSQRLLRALPGDWPRTHLRLQTLSSVHQYKTNPLPDNCFVSHRHAANRTHLPVVTQESAQTLQPRATLLRESKNKLEKKHGMCTAWRRREPSPSSPDCEPVPPKTYTAYSQCSSDLLTFAEDQKPAALKNTGIWA